METKTLAGLAGGAAGLLLGLILDCPLAVQVGAMAAWLAERGVPMPEPFWVMILFAIACPFLGAVAGAVVMRRIAVPRRTAPGDEGEAVP